MIKLVLLRHGESIWNIKNTFTGWTDVDLSDHGRQEAKESAKLLIGAGYTFDVAFTSVLIRATNTLKIVLDVMDLKDINIIEDWHLNERHYGALQGIDKKEAVETYGEEQVFLWRRGYDTPPPPLEKADERYPGNDTKYSNLSKDELPLTECLHDTLERTLPYWHEEIVPVLKEGKKVIICAHGNSLRALVKHLDNVSDDEITGLNIPTGIPLVYELDDELKPIKHYYLGDPEAAKKATDKVKHQT